MGQTCYEYRCSSTPLAGGIYAKHVCMFAKHVRMFAELVCMYAKLVCMFAKLVCMSGRKIVLWRRGQIPYENLSVFNISFNFSRFVRGGTVDDPDIPNLSAREALHTHTYIPAQSETLHRERAFEKPSTGTRLLKHTYLHIHTYIPT